jgi:hypothetical protein
MVAGGVRGIGPSNGVGVSGTGGVGVNSTAEGTVRVGITVIVVVVVFEEGQFVVCHG